MTKKADAPEDQGFFDLENIFVDINAIEEGRWVSLGAEFGGAEILARGLSSKPARKLQEQLERAVPRKKRMTNGALTPEALDEVLTTVLSERCVLDWKGIGRGGKPLEFSPQVFRDLVSDPKARRFKIAVINAITDLETRKDGAEEAVAKN